MESVATGLKAAWIVNFQRSPRFSLPSRYLARNVSIDLQIVRIGPGFPAIVGNQARHGRRCTLPNALLSDLEPTVCSSIHSRKSLIDAAPHHAARFWKSIGNANLCGYVLEDTPGKKGCASHPIVDCLRGSDTSFVYFLSWQVIKKFYFRTT